MSEPNESSLEHRVARLEAAVENLDRTLRSLIDTMAERARSEDSAPAPRPRRRVVSPDLVPSATPAHARRDPLVAKPAPRGVQAEKPWYVDRGSDYWLNKIGIGLVLFGVALFFKYAVDQGWLSPPVRIALGLALGIGLLVIGLRVHAQRPWFSRVMLGGAVATFYITGFAAYQLYELVSYGTAYGFMVLVSVLAFHLALSQREAVLSVIGAAGALGTPFLLYTEAGSIPGLMAYTSVVLLSTSAVFLFKGWRSLLGTAVVGGWMVIAVGLGAAGSGPSPDQWALQLAVLVGLAAFWAVPVVREGLSAHQPTRWPQPEPGPLLEGSPEAAKLLERHAQALTIVTPLIAFGFTVAIWELSRAASGQVALGGAALFAGAAFAVHRWRVGALFAYAHAAAAALLLTIGLGLVLEREALLLAWTAEAGALHFIGRRTANRTTTNAGHVLFFIVAAWLGQRLLGEEATGIAVFNVQAIGDVIAMAAGFMAASMLRGDEARSYRIVAHIGLLAWLWRELSTLPNGSGFVTIAWGVYGFALLVFALRRHRDLTRKVAMGTLLLVVGKLFLVDLSAVEPIWRVLLFLGFGGLFLVLSYYFRDLWQDSSRQEEAPDEE